MVVVTGTADCLSPMASPRRLGMTEPAICEFVAGCTMASATLATAKPTIRSRADGRGRPKNTVHCFGEETS